MAYTPNVWVDDDPGTTPGAVGGAVNAARMNWMETGIGAAHTTADAAVPKSLVDAAGDLIVGSANDTVARLAKGADGQWLRMTGGALVWSNIAAADIQDITTRVDVRKNSAGSVFSRRRLNLIEGSNVTLTVADDSGSEEVDVTVAATAATVEYPWLIDIDVFPSPHAHTNWDTLTLVGASAAVYNGTKDSTGAQNAEINWDVVLGAGTWTVELMFFKGATTGIYSVQFDAVEKGTIDSYAAANSYNNRAAVTGIAVGASAKIRLKLKMATKNASSSSYNGFLQHVQLRRTA